MITSGISVPTWTHANSDLWFEILERVALLGKDMIQVVKVPAHEDSHQAQNAFENWMNVCNDCADRAAKEANQNRPPSLWSLWGRHMEAVETNRHFGKVVRDHMVAVAERWTKHWKETTDEVVGPRRGLGIPAPSWPATESLQVSKQTFRRQFGAAYLSKIGQWFDTLWAVTEPVRWVSYAQLYPEHRIMITIKILVFSAIDLEGKFENQDFNQYFFMQNLDMILIEILIGNIDLKLIENIDLLLIGS